MKTDGGPAFRWRKFDEEWGDFYAWESGDELPEEIREKEVDKDGFVFGHYFMYEVKEGGTDED